MDEIVEENRQHRSTAAQQAWQVVEEEIEKYRAAVQTAEMAPLIKHLREQFDRVFDEESGILERIEENLRLTNQLQANHRRIKQRLLHEVIQELKLRLVDNV